MARAVLSRSWVAPRLRVTSAKASWPGRLPEMMGSPAKCRTFATSVRSRGGCC